MPPKKTYVKTLPPIPVTELVYARVEALSLIRGVTRTALMRDIIKFYLDELDDATIALIEQALEDEFPP